MSQDPFQHIADILNNHEVRPSANATFEEVMNRRKKKRRGIFWWFQRTGVGLLILGILGGIAYLNIQPSRISNSQSKYTQNQSPNNPASDSKSETSQNKAVQSAEDLKTNPNRTSGNSATYNNPQKKSKTGLLGIFQKFNTRRDEILHGTPRTLAIDQVQTPGALQIWSPNPTQADPKEGSNIYANGGSPMALSNVYDFGAKNYINGTYFDLQIQEDPDAYLDWAFELPQSGLRTKKLPWYAEFSAITGSDNQIQFDANENLSVLGTNYMAQYQLSFLREFKSSDLWGIGVNYTQWVGNGEWRKREYLNIWNYDTQTVAINIPGLPTQFVNQLDSHMTREFNVRTGSIKYNIDKISLPISYRGFARLFKTNFRYAAQISPGITRISKGSYFTPTEFMPIEQSRRFSFGAKVGMGPIIPVGNGLSIVIEPALMYESFIHPQKGLQGNVFGGLGISMMWRLK